MQKIFDDTRTLDESARNSFGLTEDIMMENAASALEAEGEAHFFSPDGKYINRPAALILAGAGNNGADGYALARRIVQKKICVAVCQVYEPKSALCVVQADRAKKAGAIFISPYDLDEWIERASFDLTVVYDCIFGSGFHGSLDAISAAVILSANKIQGAYKIACDIPSGQKDCAFAADKTVTMGALKTALFSDSAKAACGKIVVANLGVSRSNFEGAGRPCAMLLEEGDANLPVRSGMQNSNKGTFGHAAIFAGEKPGAAVIAGTAALKFGAGLCTLIGKMSFENVRDFALMTSDTLPQNASAIVIGPGLGRPDCASGGQKSFGNFKDADALFDFLAETEIPLVLDADIFYYPQIKGLLAKKRNVILTPHPKEFSELLKNCSLGIYSVEEAVQKRLELCKQFAQAFPGAVLLLKGANVLIAKKFPNEERPRVYVNSLGTSALAKAGSGDVLCGMAASLLAQGYETLDAAATASIRHAAASRAFLSKDYALTPFDLINEI